jgi:hypothetical protein
MIEDEDEDEDDAFQRDREGFRKIEDCKSPLLSAR